MLSRLIVGTWEVVSRIDRTRDGTVIEEPSLGSDPVALIIFDACHRFAAQFMRRSSGAVAEASPPGRAAPNNTRAVDGYDSYFGTYEVDDDKKLVTLTLTAALSRENVGMVLTREMAADHDQLVIQVPTAALDGTPVVRTLICKRAC